MQTHKDRKATSQDTRPLPRFLEALADFFSENIRCEACATEMPKRRFQKTGLTRPSADHEQWSRFSNVEIELVCPHCGHQTWIHETPVYYYPYV